MKPSQYSVLVVDDEEMNRDMLSRRLRHQGYFVSVAEHGEEAADLMMMERFDLVLLDVMMPVMNGYQFLEWLTRQPQLRTTPVIMLTASDDRDSVVACLTLGAKDYCLKPFNMAELKIRIKNCLANKAPLDSVDTSFEKESDEPHLVLIVDDEESNRELLCRRVQKSGFRAITSENGESLFNDISLESVSLILLDIDMPGMSGFDVLRKLKSSAEHRQIPVIMVSGHDEAENVKTCYELGADDYVIKPFNTAELVSSIQRTMVTNASRCRHEDSERRKQELANLGEQIREPKE